MVLQIAEPHIRPERFQIHTDVPPSFNRLRVNPNSDPIAATIPQQPGRLQSCLAREQRAAMNRYCANSNPCALGAQCCVLRGRGALIQRDVWRGVTTKSSVISRGIARIVSAFRTRCFNCFGDQRAILCYCRKACRLSAIVFCSEQRAGIAHDERIAPFGRSVHPCRIGWHAQAFSAGQLNADWLRLLHIRKPTPLCAASTLVTTSIRQAQRKTHHALYLTRARWTQSQQINARHARWAGHPTFFRKFPAYRFDGASPLRCELRALAESCLHDCEEAVLSAERRVQVAAPNALPLVAHNPE